MKESPFKNNSDSIILHYKKMEESYKKNLQFYQSLFQYNPEAVFSLDLDGRFTSANEVMLNKAECSLDEITAQDFLAFVHPDYLVEGKKLLMKLKKEVYRNFN